VQVTQDDQRANGCTFLGLVPGSNAGSEGIVYPFVKRAAYQVGGDLVIEATTMATYVQNLGSLLGGDAMFRCAPWKVKIVRKGEDALGCEKLADFKGDHDFNAISLRKKVEDTVLKLGGNVALVSSYGEFHVLKCEKLVSDLAPKGVVATANLADVEGCIYRGMTKAEAEKEGANVVWARIGKGGNVLGGAAFTCDLLPSTPASSAEK
jgi:hypothetical protein